MPRSPKQILILLLLICAVVYSAGSVRTGFTGKDELRYAHVAKEMVHLPDFFVLHYQGQIYPDKPPLFFWMVRAGYAVAGGVAPFAARAPNILSMLLTVALTFFIARRLFNDRVGLIAASAFGLAFQPIWSSHLTKLDPPLLAFTTLAMWFFVLGMAAQREGKRPAAGLVLGFWASMALGFLVKGPLGFVVPLGSLLVYRLTTRCWKNAVGLSSIGGILVFLAIISVWVLPALHFGAEEHYMQTILQQEGLDRALRPPRHIHDGLAGLFYYPAQLMGGFFPASLLLPVCVMLLLRVRRTRGKTPDSEGLKFLLSWVGFVFVFFSLMISKRGQYILPMYPALAILIGWTMDRILHGEPVGRKWTRIPLGLMATVAFLGAVVMQLNLSRIEGEIYGPIPIAAKVAFLLLLSACGVQIVRAMRNQNLRRAALAALAVIPLSLTIWFGLIFPKGSQRDEFEQFAQFADQLIPPGQYAFTRKKPAPQFTIWAQYFLQGISQPEGLRQLGFSADAEPETEELLRAFAASEQPLYLFMDSKRAKRYKGEYPGLRLRIVRHFDIPRYREDGGYLIVANPSGYRAARSIRFKQALSKKEP